MGSLDTRKPAVEDAVALRYQLAGIVVFHERQGRVRQGAPLLDVVEAVGQDPGEDRDGVHGVLAVAELEQDPDHPAREVPAEVRLLPP